MNMGLTPVMMCPTVLLNSLGPKFPHIRNINLRYICNGSVVGSGPKDVGSYPTNAEFFSFFFFFILIFFQGQ